MIRKSLPRPTIIDASMFEHRKDLDIAYNMINEEMLVLLAHDNKNHPQKITRNYDVIHVLWYLFLWTTLSS